MSWEEYEKRPRSADGYVGEIALRLMSDCGPQLNEVQDVEPRHISRISDGCHCELEFEIAGEKDTTGKYAENKQ
jgi:hypothetical protein